MNGTRQQLLAGSGLSLNENGGVGGRHGFNLLEDAAQAGALAHNVLEAVFKIDFVLEVLLLLAQLVAQLRNAAEGEGVVDSHGHLHGDTGQHGYILRPKGPLHAAEHAQGADGLAVMDQGHPAA